MDKPSHMHKSHPDTEVIVNEPHLKEETFPLLDIPLAILHNFRLVALSTTVLVALGFLIAVFRTPTYTASAQVIRETAYQSTSGGITGLAALRGVRLDVIGDQVGITVDTYPKILMSREVRLAVVRSPFYFADLDTTMSLVAYQNRPRRVVSMILSGLRKVTIGLPGTIIRLFRPPPLSREQAEAHGSATYPTEEEEVSIRTLLGLVTISVDRQSSIMTISATTSDPLLSAQLAQNFVDHLTGRVRHFYTEKTRENLEFIHARFMETEQELEDAEEELAHFMDRNRDPQTKQLLIAMERLQRKVTFASQLALELQTQYTQSEIELQRSQPVITLVEAPAPPIKADGSKRRLIVVLGLLGLGIGIAMVAIKGFIEGQQADNQARAKLAEIRELLTPSKLLGRVRRRVHRS